MMLARRAFLRVLGLGLPASLLLAGCKHWGDGAPARNRQDRDGGGGDGGY